jgi:hypothetical protein
VRELCGVKSIADLDRQWRRALCAFGMSLPLSFFPLQLQTATGNPSSKRPPQTRSSQAAGAGAGRQYLSTAMACIAACRSSPREQRAQAARTQISYNRRPARWFAAAAQARSTETWCRMQTGSLRWDGMDGLGSGTLDPNLQENTIGGHVAGCSVFREFDI